MLKDLKSEFRQRASINGILLYVVSTLFVIYMIFNQIDSLKTWTALYWIVIVFSATNVALNSFKSESGRQFLYYYSLCKAEAIMLSKLIFNACLIFLIALITFFLFNLLLGEQIENATVFLVNALIGAIGISTVLTLSAAIASKTNNNATLTAILSFPILIPFLLSIVKASLLSGVGFSWAECQNYLLLSLAINVVTVALSYILFPYLWRS